MTKHFEPIYSNQNHLGETVELYRFENNYGASVVEIAEEGIFNVAVLRYTGDGEQDYGFVDDRVNNPVLALRSRTDGDPTVDAPTEDDVEVTLRHIASLDAAGYGETGGISQDALEQEIYAAMMGSILNDVLAQLTAETETVTEDGFVDDDQILAMLNDADEEV